MRGLDCVWQPRSLYVRQGLPGQLQLLDLLGHSSAAHSGSGRWQHEGVKACRREVAFRGCETQ